MKKTCKCKHIPVPKGTEGQQPFWPGEGAQPSGKTIRTGKEKTIIPIVDSLPQKPKK